MAIRRGKAEPPGGTEPSSAEKETEVLEAPVGNPEVRMYGVPPVTVLVAAGLLGFIVGLALLLDGHLVAGGALVLAGVVLAVIFAPEISEALATRRVFRWSRGALELARNRAELSWAAIAGWSGASVELTRLRLRRRELERRHAELMREIGEAVVGGDQGRADELSAEALIVSAQLKGLDEERSRVARAVNERVDARRPGGLATDRRRAG